jgi:transposase-like protein
MANRSRTATRKDWVDRIDRFEKAGLNVAQFCTAEGVSPASFYQWRSRLRSEASANRSLTGFLPVKLLSHSHEPPSRPQPTTVMSVELPGGVRVRFEVIANHEVGS